MLQPCGMNALTSYRQIIDLWATKSALQAELGTPNGKPAHVREWATRDSIPAKWWPYVVAAAERYGFTDVTLGALNSIAKSKPKTRAPASADEAI